MKPFHITVGVVVDGPAELGIPGQILQLTNRDRVTIHVNREVLIDDREAECHCDEFPQVGNRVLDVRLCVGKVDDRSVLMARHQIANQSEVKPLQRILAGQNVVLDGLVKTAVVDHAADVFRVLGL